jgi:hypothetical protein
MNTGSMNTGSMNTGTFVAADGSPRSDLAESSVGQ